MSSKEMRNAQVTVPLTPALAAFVRMRAEEESRSIASVIRQWVLQAARAAEREREREREAR